MNLICFANATSLQVCPKKYSYHKRTNKCYWVSETLHFHEDCQRSVCNTSTGSSLVTVTNENIYFLTNVLQIGTDFVNVGLFKDPTDNWWHWMNQKDESSTEKNKTAPYKIQLIGMPECQLTNHIILCGRK